MMKNVLGSFAVAALCAFSSNASANSATIRSNPIKRADGSYSCATSADFPGYAKVSIVEAKFTDRPNLRGAQGAVMGGIRGYWYVDYEIRVYDHQPFSFGDSFMNNKARDSAGRIWQSMDNRARDNSELVSGGGTGHAKAIYISYETNGADLTTIAPYLAVSTTTPASNPFNTSHRWANIDFPAIPVNCIDQPPAPVAVDAAAGSTPFRLIRPRQISGPGVIVINAQPGTVREAVQSGFIWSYGEGVPLDFTQGRLWYEEAARLQQAKHDFALKNEIDTMLTRYRITDIEQLFTRGLRALMASNWDESIYFFGRGAEMGNPQAMAALGYVLGEGRKAPRLELYWCRKAFIAARVTKQEHDLDGVNHFCPQSAFDDVMTGPERHANPASIARAKAKSNAVKREYDAQVEFARSMISAGISDGLAGRNERVEVHYEEVMGRDSAYAHGAASAPPISSFYSDCHGYGNGC